MRAKVLKDSVVAQSKNQVSCELNGEAVILNFKKGFYYGLDSVGASVWNLLKSPMRVKEVHERVLEIFDVKPERCERDLFELLRDLLKEGLVEIKDAKIFQ